MKNLTARVMLVVLVLATAAVAGAETCDLEPTPAATLLLPYFEVGNGVTTLLSINNAAPEPVLVQITFWTDWGAPSLYFPAFLTGFDVLRINLADVFEGNIPITADAQSDPNDTVSPHGSRQSGEFQQWDGSFPDCDEIFPFFLNPVVMGTGYDRLNNGHRGQPVASLEGQCLGGDHGDGVARGYVTIDSVNRCALRSPADEGYFVDGGGGIANNRNQLWGDFFLVDVESRYAEGNPLVHIEAGGDLPETGYTFYGRYVPDGADNREPLGTVWAVPYLNNKSVGGHSDLLVWRDPTANNPLVEGADCGTDTTGGGPDWFPLNESEVVVFNESESAIAICRGGGFGVPAPDLDCFPYATGRYTWGSSRLVAPYLFGWAWLNLNLPVDDSPTGDVDFPTEGGLLAQSYVTVLHRAEGFYSVGLPALKLVGACDGDNPSLIAEWPISRF